jgi:hypothetical protein
LTPEKDQLQKKIQKLKDENNSQIIELEKQQQTN